MIVHLKKDVFKNPESVSEYSLELVFLFIHYFGLCDTVSFWALFWLYIYLLNICYEIQNFCIPDMNRCTSTLSHLTSLSYSLLKHLCIFHADYLEVFPLECPRQQCNQRGQNKTFWRIWVNCETATVYVRKQIICIKVKNDVTWLFTWRPFIFFL